MRLYGTAQNLFDRRATQDLKVGKYKIAKGTRILPQFSGPFHHSDDYFPEWRKFDFDRFAKGKPAAGKLHPAVYQPFGVGKRACIGKYFAEINLQLLLVALVKRFEFKPLENYEVALNIVIAYLPDSCYLKLKSRD